MTDTDSHDDGRVHQKRRTRSAILRAASDLLNAGALPSIAEAADAAQVSRATAYRYFSTQEHLLQELALDRAALTIDHVIATISTGGSAADRLDTVVHAVYQLVTDNDLAFRTLLRLSLEPKAAQSPPQMPRGAAGAGSAGLTWPSRLSASSWARRTTTSCSRRSRCVPASRPTSCYAISARLTRPRLIGSPAGPRRHCCAPASPTPLGSARRAAKPSTRRGDSIRGSRATYHALASGACSKSSRSSGSFSRRLNWISWSQRRPAPRAKASSQKKSRRCSCRPYTMPLWLGRSPCQRIMPKV